jgi:hypothetical protein
MNQKTFVINVFTGTADVDWTRSCIFRAEQNPDFDEDRSVMMKPELLDDSDLQRIGYSGVVAFDASSVPLEVAVVFGKAFSVNRLLIWSLTKITNVAALQ